MYRTEPRQPADSRDRADRFTDEERPMSPQQAAVIGDALRPGDDGYDAAARVFFRPATRRWWSGLADPDEVAAALAHAARHDLAVSVRSGGHSPLGHGTNTGGMVIDLAHLDDVEVLDDRPAARAGRRRRDLGPGGRGARSARLGAHRRRHLRRRRRRPDPGRRDRLDGAPVRTGDRQPGRRTGGDRRWPATHDLGGRAPRPVLGAARRRRQLRRGGRLRLHRPARQHRALRDGRLPARRPGRVARPVARRDAGGAGGAVQHAGVDAAGYPARRRRRRCCSVTPASPACGVRGRRRDRAAARAGHGDRGEHLRAPVRRDP